MANQAINPFTDKPVEEGFILTRITPRDDFTETTVAIQILQQDESSLVIKFIEWDFLVGNAQDAEYQKIKPLIQGLWQNGYPIAEGREVITLALLQQKLRSAPIPRTPKEKLDNLLLHLVQQQSDDGESLSISLSEVYKKLYFRSLREAQFYLQTLGTNGQLNLVVTKGEPWSATLTYQGLAYTAALENEGPTSSLCFIAISFAPERAPYRDAIVRAVRYHGYEPRVVDSDYVVKNDTPVIQILAGIRRARFCISDFTLQRTGVYFEAGYALGLGRPVIYLCDRQDFEANSHFDLRPFQHILYSEVDEMEQALQLKIAAWIGSKRAEYNAQPDVQ